MTRFATSRRDRGTAVSAWPRLGRTTQRARPAPQSAEIERLRRELADSRRQIRELEALSLTDALCDVLNRRGFDRELQRALAHARRYGGTVGVLLIDLDGFKPVNDRLGHAAGDRLLRAAAETLVRDVRASDSVARIGGDEFAIILHNISAIDIDVKAHSIEAQLDSCLGALAGSLPVGGSCGAAIARPDEAPDALMARADLAMYRRKGERKAVRR
jgi:diguanylate cyclase (GGDEF)-like protein